MEQTNNYTREGQSDGVNGDNMNNYKGRGSGPQPLLQRYEWPDKESGRGGAGVNRLNYTPQGVQYRGRGSGPQPLMQRYEWPDKESSRGGAGVNRLNYRQGEQYRHEGNMVSHGTNSGGKYNYSGGSRNYLPNQYQQPEQLYNHQQRFDRYNVNNQQQQQRHYNPQGRNREDHRDRRDQYHGRGMDHRGNEYHPEILKLLEEEEIFQLRKKTLRFPKANFLCRLCEYHSDDPQHCIQHIKSNRHQKLSTVREFEHYLASLPLPSGTMISAVDETLEAVSLDYGITEQEHQQRHMAVEDLAEKLAKVVPDATLEMAGSSFSGLALKTSDVNVNLFVPDKQSPFTTIMALKDILEQCEDYTEVTNDLRSSFPSLSYTSSRHSDCRIVVVVGVVSVRAMARLMKCFANIDRRFVVLARTLMYWAKLCNVSDQKSGSLPTVAYVVMVAHFLQQTNPPILPIVKQLSHSAKPEDFPLLEEIKSNFKSKNTDSVGKLWLHMLHYYGHQFKFNAFNINVTHLSQSPRTDKTYSKKMSIEDPFNPKRNLTRTVSNAIVLEFIMDRLLKILCRYFSVPQLSYGQLFYTLTIDNMLVKEKRVVNSSLNESSDKGTNESEEKDDSSELDMALERLSLRDSTIDSEDGNENVSTAIRSPDHLSVTFDTITRSEASRIIRMLEEKHYNFEFKEEKFTEGESVPIYCTSCQKEGHTRDQCEDEKLPALLPLPEVNDEYMRMISSVLVKLREEMEPSDPEIKQRENVVNKLQFFIRKEYKYREAELQLFGSSANGFGFSNSDLDVCITFDDDIDKEQLDQNNLIHELARILKQSREFTEVFAISTAKVPIVKFRCSATNFEGDLSLFNTLALHNTKMLLTYSKIDPRVRILGYGLKYFAKRCDIGDASRGSLSSYAFTLLLIHFLQQCQPPLVPVLQQLYAADDVPDPVLVDGWNAWFYSSLEDLPTKWSGYRKNTSSVAELWLQMFRYYTETFDFDENVITIRQKEPLSRLEKLWNNHSIAIEDPFDLNHNLGGALTRKMNTFIMKAFISGRNMYGGTVHLPPQMDNAARLLFDPNQLTAGAPPNDRGCRRCGRIGHLGKNCPQRAPENFNKKKAPRDPLQARQESASHFGNGNTNKRAIESTIGNVPTKKKDDGALVAEKGLSRVESTLPEGTETVNINMRNLLDLLKQMLGTDKDRNGVLALGYRIYTVAWFLNIHWCEPVTYLKCEVLFNNKEPLILVRLKPNQPMKSQKEYFKQFSKHTNYFEEYLIDLSLIGFDSDDNVEEDEEEDTPSLEEGLFKKGLDDAEKVRREKTAKKKAAKKTARKARREELKKIGEAGMKRTPVQSQSQKAANPSGSNTLGQQQAQIAYPSGARKKTLPESQTQTDSKLKKEERVLEGQSRKGSKSRIEPEEMVTKDFRPPAKKPHIKKYGGAKNSHSFVDENSPVNSSTRKTSVNASRSILKSSGLKPTKRITDCNPIRKSIHKEKMVEISAE